MIRTLKTDWYRWTAVGRAVVFVLAASSIWCLLAEFYGLCTMQAFTLFISLPALALLSVMACLDRRSGDRRLYRAVLIGSLAGLAAAAAYDVFRLPFVFSNQLGLAEYVPALPLFKVFPRFGAMLLGQPVEQTTFSLSAHLHGWAYHFSNGLTFGIMYLAAVGDASKRHWIWAVLLAVGLELAMLLTPYPQFFAIKIGVAFVLVTLTAHLVFGVVLGLLARYLSLKS